MNRDTLLQKAAQLEDYLNRLHRVGSVSWGEYETDERIRYSVERNMQLIVDCSIDIASSLLFEARRPAASSYYKTFLELLPIGIIKKHLADELAGYASFRNLLVHDYAEIEDYQVYNKIKPLSKSFAQLLVIVRKHLGETDAANSEGE